MERRREFAIRGLVVYLREKEEDHFKEQVNHTRLYFVLELQANLLLIDF